MTETQQRSELSPQALREAEKLQRVLEPLLEHWNSHLVTRGELERGALERYAREFGSKIGERQLRRYISRTIQRAGEVKDWSRLELYLPNKPEKAATHRADLASDEQPFAGLLDKISGFRESTNPSSDEEASLWLEAWRIHSGRLKNGIRPKRAKAELIQFLTRRAGWLTQALNRDGMRVLVKRKFAKLDHASGGVASEANAAVDGRRAKRGHPRAERPTDAEVSTMVAAGIATGKRWAQAERNLVAMGPEESGIRPCILEPMAKGKSKSHSNRRIAKIMRPELDNAYAYHLGKLAIDNATASITRERPEHSMKVVTGDDFTFPVKIAYRDAWGRVQLMRPQVLLFGDGASLKILTRVLIPYPSYGASDIAGGMGEVCTKHGVPENWSFERGMWKDAHLVKGTAPKGWELAWGSGVEMEHKWERLGVRFMHHTRAKSKLAEMFGRHVQNFMERCKGYCGRNERFDCPEETRQAELAVKRKINPSDPEEHFYDLDQWECILDEIIDSYNAEIQEGRYCAGRSPDQAFKDYWPTDGVTPVSAEFWHLIAYYRRECFVSTEGVVFNLGKTTYKYFDEALGPYRNQRVQIWFDPTHPEILGVCNLDGQQFTFVQRSQIVAFDAGLADGPKREALKNELAKQAGFNKYAKTRYRSAKVEFERLFRKTVTDKKTAEIGREINLKRVEALREQTVVEQRRNRIERMARQLGTPVDTLRDDSEATEQSLRSRLERRKAMEAETE